MGWEIGFDPHWQRDIGYGVPSICDKPGCSQEIDRGLSFVCGGDVYGGEQGCGLFFCHNHLFHSGKRGFLCPRCLRYETAYKRPKPDTLEWREHKLTHESWKEWREANPEKVKALYE